ncbi:autoinducer 2 ABC transporter substrate-binding protein [Cryobacterium sp. TMS1-20-1]|uniref:Autoinducer 2 ABC transporter substrate-binding protein n=1 Tax=Cryobacterium levicorallinum TaxID=995038 RepID=A0A1I2YSG5_9MICO|nr:MULTISPECIES: autoinducer 2 ABC transporter substrate-binding protein [Cryobacterium]TFB86130.1 autoinducer 2 ABC transporter substrate-binding protein [Cryobacterium levicorallinum]TFC71446.1 autoinducer 2 ABC transporter substrate-binding protein [Cryobacterium sp. TMS1-20-1]TFD64977.1 autoinducer 2 ABC transporter substrate-binding protein [Cryobacterium sp. Hh38]SFH28199.1 simple sugar transport system substrate-binding protein [Cryobacterium levicorallinum]GEP27681.1 autoinducer 2 ABC 
MNHKHALRGTALLVGAALALTGCSSVGSVASGSSSTPAADDMVMVTVVKAQTIPWFQRMEVGVKSFADRTGIDARQEGADDVSPEKQVQIVQDLIAQQPTAITVVPNSPEALSSVLKQARDQGIIVVSHEATGIENVDIDIEAFDNPSYGSEIMDNLAECMGDTGEYVQFVGGLTAKTHMEWVGAAYDNQQANFPNMTRVETPIESTDDQGTAYERAKEVLAKYPNIAGFQGSAGNDVPGIARAVQEAGLEDQVCVMGTSIPSVANQYLADGSIDKIFFWDPALAGEAQLAIALILADGGTIEDGTDLGIEGYNSLKKLDGYDNVFVGAASVAADAATAAKYNF